VARFRTEKHSKAAAPIVARAAAVDGPSRQDVAGSRVAALSAPTTRLPTHAASQAPYLIPPEGVYTFHTSGSESISLAGAHHDYPPTTTGTLRHTGGCGWTFTNTPIKEHTDILTMCSKPGNMFQTEQARYISFYGKTDGGAYTFDPPQLVSRVGEAPGTATDSIGESTKHDGEVRIVRTFVERTTLQIGTQTVP